MVCYELVNATDAMQKAQGSFGGNPALPLGTTWPKCKLCNDELVHFLEVDLPAGASPFQAVSRLQIFACREHDDIAGTIYSDYSRYDTLKQSRQLPDQFWEVNDGHYLLRLLPPVTPTESGKPEMRLATVPLKMTPVEDMEAEPSENLKLLGYPFWVQDPEEFTCCCGSPMQLLLQVPNGTGFDMAPGAPHQPNSFSRSKYCLFLGNDLYLLACVKQCHPQAVWPVLQN